MNSSSRRRTLILGAAGRDFHNFNVLYRDDRETELVAFTAAQIPHIDHRSYPPELAGELYPEGIPIVPEKGMGDMVRQLQVDRVVFSYSDISHEDLMHKASEALAAGADFVLPSPEKTMLKSRLPVIGVCAVRTGCGKSQLARWIAAIAKQAGLRPAAIRHPMPYGNPARQVAQRFATRADLRSADCTIEEREEYEPHLETGSIVYAGIDYAKIVQLAEAESDLVIWDGGNNDLSFIKPDLLIVLLDPLRPGHELKYHPGETALRMADIVVIAKHECAPPEAVEQLQQTVARINPGAQVLRGCSPVHCDEEQALEGQRVLVVEDGPTLTHGGMPWGAGHVLATRAGARIVDPRPWLAPALQSVFEQYPHLHDVVPAMGYYPEQLQDLANTINASAADAVVCGTPIDLARLLDVNKPVYRVRYDYADADSPGLKAPVQAFIDQLIKA